VFKAVTNWAGQPLGAARDVPEEGLGGPHEPQVVGLVDHDLHGAITFIFVVLHLRRSSTAPGTRWPRNRRCADLYRLLLEVFQSPVYVVSYVLCMGLIVLHLRHGLSSALQSLGVNHPATTP